MSHQNGNGAATLPLATKTGVDGETLVPPVDAIEGFIESAVSIAKQGVRARTTENFDIATFIVRAIEHDVTHGGCTVREKIGERREHTWGRFSLPLSKAMSESLTSGRLSEYVRIFYLRSLLSAEDYALCSRVNWESLRELAQWAIHQPNKAEFTPLDGETPGTYAEVWEVKKDCGAKLSELIGTLSRETMTRPDLKKAMRRFEAELAGESVDEDEGITVKAKMQFLASIETRLKALKLTKRQFTELLIGNKMLVLDSQQSDPAKMSVADAAKVAASLIAVKNKAAIREMRKRFKAETDQARTEVSNDRQGSKAATPPLNDSGKPNDTPLDPPTN